MADLFVEPKSLGPRLILPMLMSARASGINPRAYTIDIEQSRLHLYIEKVKAKMN